MEQNKPKFNFQLKKFLPDNPVDEELNVFFSFAGKKDENIYSSGFKITDKRLNGLLTDGSKRHEFDSGAGKFFLVQTQAAGNSRFYLTIGLGKRNLLDMSAWMNAVAIGVKQALGTKTESMSLIIPDEILAGLTPDNTIRRTVEAAYLAQYKFDKHKSKSVSKLLRSCTIYLSEDFKNPEKLIQTAANYARAVDVARDLVNEPSSVVTPRFLADYAMSLAEGSKKISVEVLGPKEIKALKMNAFLGIAQGSDEEPRFIKMTYNIAADKTICLVGKGITFDSGGLSIKTGNGMETMKCDMAGAAVILGIFTKIAEIGAKYNVVGLIAATENMPSGKAIKPGDVVKASNGKTIEVANTDAEGRVVLSDAVSYAQKFVKPDEMIDLATLTGACVVALGEDIAGLFANNQQLADKLLKNASQAGERLWQMPLVREYRKLLKSNVADIRNISKIRYGGAITGALFIADFVSDELPWVHLDIAGPAFAESDSALVPEGGSGYGVRMLLDYLNS